MLLCEFQFEEIKDENRSVNNSIPYNNSYNSSLVYNINRFWRPNLPKITESLLVFWIFSYLIDELRQVRKHYYIHIA